MTKGLTKMTKGLTKMTLRTDETVTGEHGHPVPDRQARIIPANAPIMRTAPKATAEQLASEKGGAKLDAGKAPMWLVPWEVLELTCDPKCAGMAQALVAWVRRDDDCVDLLRGSLTAELVEGAAHILGFGAEKYAAWNWEKGIRFTRIAAAGLRHALWRPNGEENDPESGLPHRHHLACNVIFAITLTERLSGGFDWGDWDDRPAAPELPE